VEEPRSVGLAMAHADAPSASHGHLTLDVRASQCSGRFAEQLDSMLDGSLDCFVSQPAVSGGS
jgi:hypothetical protein